eukprot:GFUD01046348.1.p1 GENE.GFUD01046348.1~~GFUD01046348.1.p1  ORF type:complete len:499 (+),score=66.83 GFUD01046348.1:80-1576(+)
MNWLAKVAGLAVPLRGVTVVESFLGLISSPLKHFVTDRHIQMVLKQQAMLSNDIEQNPGPFFEECFKVVTEFCNDENNDNDFYLRTCVSQLTSNQAQVSPIPFPEDFLLDGKVDIWRRCELKIKRNTAFEDEFRKDLQNIWRFWFQALFQKDLNKSRKGTPQSPKSRSNPMPNNPVGSESKATVARAPIEHMSIAILDNEKKHCGFYKYGRSTNGKSFFCFDDICKNSKLKSVTRETLRNHAMKIHLKEINFQSKTGKVIKEGLRCRSCSKPFSRKQTLADHQRKYHPDMCPLANNDAHMINNRSSNNDQQTTVVNQNSCKNIETKINPTLSATDDVHLTNNYRGTSSVINQDSIMNIQTSINPTQSSTNDVGLTNNYSGISTINQDSRKNIPTTINPTLSNDVDLLNIGRYPNNPQVTTTIHQDPYIHYLTAIDNNKLQNNNTSNFPITEPQHFSHQQVTTPENQLSNPSNIHSFSTSYADLFNSSVPDFRDLFDQS